MSAPTVCMYCDGHGNGTAGPCGFCEQGKPLDTSEDWDNSWGQVFDHVEHHRHQWTAQRGDDRWRCSNCTAWISKLVDRRGRVIPLPPSVDSL